MTGRMCRPQARAPLVAADIATTLSPGEALKRLVGSPELSSKRWVWEQYDHLILGNTVEPPGGDAAVVRVLDGPKGLAMTCDVTPRYCEADPYRGRQAGRGGGLAQHHRRRRHAPRRHRQPQFRQSRAARDHGPARRPHRRHRRGLPGARLPDRLRQRLALQRDQRARHPADPDDRRRRPARRCRQGRDDRASRPPTRR